MNKHEQRVHELAYQIWESEGRPVGHEYRHWEMARKQADAPVNADTQKIGSGHILSAITPETPEKPPKPDPVPEIDPAPPQPGQPTPPAEPEVPVEPISPIESPPQISPTPPAQPIKPYASTRKT